MKVAFIGSVSSSWHALNALIQSGVELTCAMGVDESRSSAISDYHNLRPLADQADIPYCSFLKVTDSQVLNLVATHPPDLLWVIGLSQLVGPSLLDLAPAGGVGFHPTPLPNGRGRAPVAWTILLDRPAAATLFFLTDEPDAGDIIAQRSVPVMPDDYSQDLIERTNIVLANVIRDLAPSIKSGSLPRIPQDHSRATYYQKRTHADGLIDWSQPGNRIYRLIRAAGRPYPGSFTYAAGRKVTVWRAKPESLERTDHQPGTVIEADPLRGFLVSTADGALRLTEAQPEQSCDAIDVLRPGLILTSIPD